MEHLIFDLIDEQRQALDALADFFLWYQDLNDDMHNEFLYRLHSGFRDNVIDFLYSEM